MAMGGRAALICTMFLVLVTIGCEREDLRYDTPDTPGTETGEGNSSGIPGDNRHIAELLAGDWQGSATMDFIDSDNKLKHNEFDDVRLSFLLPEDHTMWGSGKESDYRDGKRVWMMSFTWQVDSTDALILKYADGRQMTSKKSKYTLEGDDFHAKLVSTDLIETDEYTLKRVTP